MREARDGTVKENAIIATRGRLEWLACKKAFRCMVGASMCHWGEAYSAVRSSRTHIWWGEDGLARPTVGILVFLGL